MTRDHAEKMLRQNAIILEAGGTGYALHGRPTPERLLLLRRKVKPGAVMLNTLPHVQAIEALLPLD